jgi:hypothetical protein
MTTVGDDDDGIGRTMCCFLTLVEGLQRAPEFYGKATNQGEAAEGAGLNREIICIK